MGRAGTAPGAAGGHRVCKEKFKTMQEATSCQRRIGTIYSFFQKKIMDGMKHSLDSLTGLRFIAAFMVVLLHFGNPPAPHLVHNIISQGFVAVSLFFILSGFILTYNYIDTEGRLKTGKREFMLARFSRIYPAYLLGFVIYAPFALKEIAAIDAHSPWVNTTYFAVAALGLVQSWSTSTALVWNSPAWSLSAEAFFYLLFPFVAPLIVRLNGRSLLLAGLLFWLASMAAFFVHQLHPHFDRNFWVFNPLLRLPEFLLGIVLGKFWLTRKSSAFQQVLERHCGTIAMASVIPQPEMSRC
jgi:peptidoglycan/LPS O-acetylase OafA/YrhL